jgi:hypothetical protein
MSSAQAAAFRSRSTSEGDIDQVLLHIKGLVLVRALLEAQGASQAAIADHSAELERQRERLAELVSQQMHPRPKELERMPGD